jgi:hypothetical protein
MSNTEKLKCISIFIVSAILLFGFAIQCSAMPILSGSYNGSNWSASDIYGRSATAEFSIAGNYLNIVLTNTSQTIDDVPNEVLAGIFFDFTGSNLIGSPTVTFSGTKIYDTGAETLLSGADISSEYASLTNITNNYGMGSYGISSTAFDEDPQLPGGWGGFGNSLPQPQPSGGLVSNATIGNGSSFSSSMDYEFANSVTIAWMLQSVPSSGNWDIGQVNFLYGTDLVSVPEPSTMLLLGCSLILFAGIGRRFIKKG